MIGRYKITPCIGRIDERLHLKVKQTPGKHLQARVATMLQQNNAKFYSQKSELWRKSCCLPEESEDMSMQLEGGKYSQHVGNVFSAITHHDALDHCKVKTAVA